VTNLTEDPSNDELNQAPASAFSLRFKRAGLVLYGAVLAGFLAAMVYVLVQPRPISGAVDQSFSDDEVMAILQSPAGDVELPLASLDEVLPVQRVAPSTSALPIATIPAWQSNASSWNPDAKAMIAIVIDDLGLNADASLQLATIEPPLTLAFLPYAEELKEQTAILRKNGHELLVHMPMEPKNKNTDPGPNALVSGLDAEEFERRMNWSLSRFDDFVGINNHMGSALTEDPALMIRVMASLRKRGFLFLDSLTSSNSVALIAAKSTNVPHIARDVFLDNDRTMSTILQQLAKVERIAAQRGYAVAIGHPYPETLKALQFWRAGLDADRYTIVPLSQLVAQNTARVRAAATAANAR